MSQQLILQIRISPNYYVWGGVKHARDKVSN